MDKKVDIKKVGDHYEIYVDGELYCTCKISELTETLEKI